MISDMKKASTIQQIDKKILQLKRQLMALGPMHPGSLSKQYSVCGRAGCKCIDPKHPQPHGPYTKLTFAHRGRFICRFVRAESVEEVTAMVQNYKTFRWIIDQLVDLAIQRAQLGPLCLARMAAKPPSKGQEPPQK